MKNRIKLIKKLALVATLIVIPLVSKAQAASATFAWTASPATNIVNYSIYYGVSSGAYTNHVNVGNATTGSVPNLVVGTTYYFACTGVDNFGLESLFSNEVVYTVPRPRPAAPTGFIRTAP